MCSIHCSGVWRQWPHLPIPMSNSLHQKDTSITHIWTRSRFIIYILCETSQTIFITLVSSMAEVGTVKCWNQGLHGPFHIRDRRIKGCLKWFVHTRDIHIEIGGLVTWVHISAVLLQTGVWKLSRYFECAFMHFQKQYCYLSWKILGMLKFWCRNLLWTIEHANSHSETLMQRFARHGLCQAYKYVCLTKPVTGETLQ